MNFSLLLIRSRVNPPPVDSYRESSASVRANRLQTLGMLLLVSGLLGGCVREPRLTEQSMEGLQRAPSNRGVLLVKPNHNIGGYDQVLFNPVRVDFRSSRNRLPEKDVVLLSESLENFLRRRAGQAQVSVASGPGPCAMSMSFSILNISVEDGLLERESASRTGFVRSMGAVSLEVVIRDSVSGEALLRFTERANLSGTRFAGGTRRVFISELANTLGILLTDFGARMFEVIPRSNEQRPVSPECYGTVRVIGDNAGTAR